jgi:hypothetical protein
MNTIITRIIVRSLLLLYDGGGIAFGNMAKQLAAASAGAVTLNLTKHVSIPPR